MLKYNSVKHIRSSGKRDLYLTRFGYAKKSTIKKNHAKKGVN